MSTASAQQSVTMRGPLYVEMRCPVPDAILTVEVQSRGKALTAMSVIGGAPGYVLMHQNGGTAVTPAFAVINRNQGSVTLRVPTTGYQLLTVIRDSTERAVFTASGHQVDLVRDSLGVLTITAAQVQPTQPTTKAP